MDQIKDRGSLAWLVTSIAALVAAQILFTQREQFASRESLLWLGLILPAVSALSLMMGRKLSSAPVEEDTPDSTQVPVSIAALRISGLPGLEDGGRPIAILVSLGLILITLWRIPHLEAGESHLVVFIIWLAAILIFVAAVGEPVEQVDWRSWLMAHRNEILIVSLLVLAGFLLRVWRVGTLPYTLAGDEASQGLEAVRVIRGELRSPFTTGWLGVPTMSFFYNGLSLRLFGQTIFALRVPWVLIGTATILTTYLLVRQLFNWRLGLATAALLAVYHYHIHFSRLGSNQIADPFFLSLALFLLYMGKDRQSIFFWALTGVVTGLSFYFYAGARLTVLVLFLVLAYLFLLDRRFFWSTHARGIGAMTVSFLITAAPMLQYAVRFPNDFNARLNQVGIIQSGWLENEVGIRGQSMLLILLDQFKRAALAFNVYPDRTVWYGLTEPLLDPLFGAVFLTGVIYGTLQLFDRQEGPRIAPLVAWMWAGMLLGGMLTESPPSSQRLITLSVPACFFIAYTIREVLILATSAFGRVPSGAITAIVVAIFAFISLNTYFIEYTPRRIYGGNNAEFATEIAPALNALKENNNIFVVGAPHMYWGFATFPYLVPDAVGVDIEGPVAESLPAEMIPQDKGSLFIVLPQRQSELAVLESTFPEGEVHDIMSTADGSYLGTLFQVAPGG